jgi:hypothetical protein
LPLKPQVRESIAGNQQQTSKNEPGKLSADVFCFATHLKSKMYSAPEVFLLRWRYSLTIGIAYRSVMSCKALYPIFPEL